MPDVNWEKRVAPRTDVFGDAVIIARGVREKCIIRDLSATGAKIEVSQQIRLPKEFDVLLMKTNSVRRVILRWRHGDFAGVRFASQSKTATHPEGASGNKLSSRRRAPNF